MACEKCLEYQGDSTTHYSDFAKVFEVIESHSTSMTEGGTAACRFCNQKIKYDFDETLIPKLRIDVAAPIQPQFVESASRDESGIMCVEFFRHDNYATLERRLKSGWAHLGLELNHSSSKFQHEGWDIMDASETFGDLTKPNEIAFTLDDETTAGEASRLFSEFSGGTAYVVRELYPVENPETLAYCNNPFRLPLNEFTYGEFKRRFSERWTNLSIELYKNPPHEVGAPHESGELAEDFEMRNLEHADKAFLHDYIYISTWGDKLVYTRIAAAIKNNRFGIYSEKNYRRMILKEFNEAKNAEWLREKSIR